MLAAPHFLSLLFPVISFANSRTCKLCYHYCCVFVILSQAGASDFQHNKNTSFPVNTTDGFPFLCFSGFHGVLICFLSSVPSFPVDLLVYDVSVIDSVSCILNGLSAPLFAIYQFLGREFVFFDFTLPLQVCKWFYDVECRMAEGVESWWHAVKSMQQTSIVIKENRCYSLLRC